MADTNTFAETWRKAFPYPPTSGQDEVIDLVSAFLFRPAAGNAFLLKGYAGTGKTSLISSLVNVLRTARLRSVLLAP
ncbi:MAG TPA: hypothetical protein VK994_04840, partial [Bacteroidales bacterium]|nr:hypothetical protein [Bacteroidales bacterium]